MKTRLVGLFSCIAIFMAMITKVLSAPYIIGDLTFVGGARLDGPLGSATKINSFSAPPTVISVDGDLALFASPSDPVLFTVPFTFGVSTAYPTLYSVGGWNFELFNSAIDTQNANFLAILGNGELSGNGYEPTPAIFRFSTQSPSAGGIFSFSASSSSVDVPDGGGSTMLLSAIPLLLIGALRKFNK